MVLALATYSALERSDQKLAVQKFRDGAQIKRDVEAFQRDIKSIKTVDDLIKNRKVMAFVLSAYGLDSEINYLGRIKAVMNSKLGDANSVVNKLRDPRYREMAAELLTQSTGVANLKLPATLAKVVERYQNAEYEKFLGTQDPSVREARYFIKNIGKVTDVYQILADPVLRSVVTQTLGLPPQFAVQSTESQAELLKRKLDIAQFKTATSTNTTSLRTNIETDIAGLNQAVAIGRAASTASDAIVNRLQSIITGYGNLTALQDPVGVNAAEIPIHSAAIPELVRHKGMANAAGTVIDSVADALNRMSTLRGLAEDPANAASLADYKTEFAALKAEIDDAIVNGAKYKYDGATHNLLDGSIAGPLSVTISSSGASVTRNTFDLTDFRADIATANTAFQAVTDASDVTNLAATATSISTGGPKLGQVRETLLADNLAAAQAIASITDFTATLDTSALARGIKTVDDAESRLTQISTKLSELKTIAQESAARAAGDDRSDLIASSTTLINEINTLIATPGAGADNILAGSDLDYTLTSAKSVTLRTGGLDTAVTAPLAMASVANQASANALVTQINASLFPSLTSARARIELDEVALREAATVYDPRGKLDAKVAELAAQMPNLVAQGSAQGRNMLNGFETSYVVQLKSGSPGATVVLTPQTGYSANVKQKISDASQQLPGNLSGAGGALELLGDALTYARNAAASLGADRRRAEGELFSAQRRLAAAPPAPANTAPKPTEYAKRFVQRFLALKDAEAARAQSDSLSNLQTGLLSSTFQV